MGYYQFTEITFHFSPSSSTVNASENVGADKLDSVDERLMILRCRRKTNGEDCLEHGLANVLVAVDSERYERFRKDVRSSV